MPARNGQLSVYLGRQIADVSEKPYQQLMKTIPKDIDEQWQAGNDKPLH